MNMIETDCGSYIRLMVEGRIDVTTSQATGTDIKLLPEEE